MHVKINVYSSLRHYLPPSEKLVREKDWDVPPDAAVSHVLEKLNLPKGVQVVVLVNNKSVHPMAVLREGDVIHILPQMMGG